MAGSKKTFKSIKLNMFFFFLLLAIVFWALTKFSKENTAKITAQLGYDNVPETFLLDEENPNTINFDITSNGFDFLVYKMKQPTVTIDVSKYFDEATKKAIVPNNLLKEEIGKQINYNGSVRNLSKDKLDVQLQGIQSKMVPVVVNWTVGYREGFKPVDSIAPTPDSVLVAGPQRFLDSITSVATKQVNLSNVGSTISERVALEEIPFPQLSTKTNSVTITQQVVEYAQKKLTIPIETKNFPTSVTLKMIPDKITLVCIVPIAQFSTITAKDFKVICDYADRNTEENFLTPKLVEAPKAAKNIELEPKKIDFLIFK